MILKICIITMIFILLCDTYNSSTCQKYIKFFPELHCANDNSLESGSAGTVFLVANSTQKYILKQQPKSNRSDAELEYLSKLKSVPYVVHLFQKKIIKNDVLTIMEYGSKGCLFDLLVDDEQEDFLSTQREILVFFKKLIEGVEGIHNQGIIHADLKLENIVVDKDNNPMIIDFDLAVKKNSENNGRGTLSYMSPEIHDAMYNKRKIRFTDKADVYSLGIILFALTEKNFPFDLQEAEYNPKDYLLHAPLKFEEGFPYDIMNIILICLQLERTRSTLENLKNKVIEVMLKPTNKKIQKDMIYTIYDLSTEKVGVSSKHFTVDDTPIIIEQKYKNKNLQENDKIYKIWTYIIIAFIYMVKI